MSTHEAAKKTAAEPGQAGATGADIQNAEEAAARARGTVVEEQRRLISAKAQGETAQVAQQRRVDDAQRDLDAAEAFEEQVANGNL